jgi:alpha-L-rhamnosidase
MQRIPISICAALIALASGAPAQNAGRGGQGAVWIAAPEAPARDYGVYHFRRTFEMPSQPASFIVRVTADNRYKLFVNGRQASIGPARGDLLNWRYETVDIASFLKPGRNVLAAVVWNFGDHAPGAQISRRTGFLVQGETAAERIADTGLAWKAVRNTSYRAIPYGRVFQYGYYVAGPGDHVDGSLYPWGWEQPDYDDSGWKPAVSIGRPALRSAGSGEDWWLVPRSIPQMELTPERVGTVRRSSGVTPPAAFPAQPAAFSVPARSKAVILVDRTHLTTAYPELVVSGGKGAQVTVKYAETLRYPGKKDPGNRNDIEGKVSEGNQDEFIADGGARRLFSTLWWRTWRYLELTVETRDEPLTIDDLRSVYTGYPFERKARFDSDSAEIKTILDTGWRTARLCAHETYIDCPYYEQLQYVGDTRVQSLLSIYNTGDARLMRNAIELVDDTRTGDLLTFSRAPSSIPQYIPGFSLWWIGMVHDYWMYQDDPEFVKRMLPGVRANLAWFARLQKPNGSLSLVPFWNIVDSTRRLRAGEEEPGWAPSDLQLLLAYQWAAELEDGVGYKGLAQDYRKAAEQLRATISNLYADPARKLFADTPDRKVFSQASNAMAILAGLVKPEEARAWIDRAIDDPAIEQSGLYFRYYLHAAANAAGAGDRYLDLLDPWRRMLKLGLTTWGEFDASDTRSDCHAWSASPNIEVFRTILGIDSAAPGFKRVIVRPFLGKLTRASGSIPHPKGEIAVNLALRDGKLQAEVTLPPGIDGDFVWKNERRPLRPGQNKLSF